MNTIYNLIRNIAGNEIIISSENISHLLKGAKNKV